MTDKKKRDLHTETIVKVPSLFGVASLKSNQ